MCGLLAWFGFGKTPTARLERAMVLMQARGPDAEGRYQSDGVFLGHRRLAILDLDPRSNQPMSSLCGRYQIVFNGEIYNHRELRLELEKSGRRFRTNSDTEVLLALFEEKNERMLPLLAGMFAFVIWDTAARVAFAARDPYGIKPLYIGKSGDDLIFSSQVKPLIQSGLVEKIIDPIGSVGFKLLGSVPEPYTLYSQIKALRSGHCVWVKNTAAQEQKCWHDISSYWRKSVLNTSEERDVRQAVREALKESISRHIVSDVPIGVFLSGGIDSSAVAALMLEQGARDLTGITIAYDDYQGRLEDEAPVAAEIASIYGIRHHIRTVTKDEFLSDMPKILASMDQPSIDGVNTWYANKAVAELGLKVVVSGVGGDELFLGYPTFKELPRLVKIWKSLSQVPGITACAQKYCEFHARKSGNLRWESAPQWLQSIQGAWWLRRSIEAPQGIDIESLGYRGVLEKFSPAIWIEWMSGDLPTNPVLALGQIESTTYLRNQLLRDSDWASMAHSVELRTPLVDARLLANVSPFLLNFQDFPNKSLLALAPRKQLPRHIRERPKTGFGIPIAKWLSSDKTGNYSRPRSDWLRIINQHFGSC